MRLATAYSKCYILYLFVTVILLSLTSLHMCVVVAAEEPLEENVVAELKQKAGEVEALAGDVKKSNEKMVASAKSVLSLLTKASESIDQETEKEKWGETLKATNIARERAQKAEQDAEKIQNAANEAGGAMEKMAARAKVILGDVENMRSLIGELKNETDTTISLWSKVSSDDVQSLLTNVSVIVEETKRAKEEAEKVPEKIKQILQEKETTEGQKEKSIDKPGKHDLSKSKGVEELGKEKKGHEKQEFVSQSSLKQPNTEPEINEKTEKAVRQLEESVETRPPEETLPPPVQERVLSISQLPKEDDEEKDEMEEDSTVKILRPINKIVWLMQNEMAAETEAVQVSEQENKKEKELVNILARAVEKAKELNDAAQLVNKKIDNAQQLSEEVAQLADKVNKIRESKELSVLPSSFGGLVFVVNNICLTTVVTLTYMLEEHIIIL